MSHRPNDTPALGLYLSEPVRCLADLGLYFAAQPFAPALPRGDGHPVLVLPGLLADDSSTGILRSTLRYLGYHAHGWRLGRNLGPTAAVIGGLRHRLADLQGRYGRPMSVIGWSLGGIFAREMARESPASIRQVITLGSPFRMDRPSQSRAYAAYRQFSAHHVVHDAQPRRRNNRPLPVPTTAIYSRLDGIVDWRTCIDRTGPHSENIAVTASHVGMGHHPAVIWAVADRLAQPDGSWAPFRPPAVLRSAFPLSDEPGRKRRAAAA